jgi:hypothetical protein
VKSNEELSFARRAMAPGRFAVNFSLYGASARIPHGTMDHDLSVQVLLQQSWRKKRFRRNVRGA